MPKTVGIVKRAVPFLAIWISAQGVPAIVGYAKWRTNLLVTEIHSRAACTSLRGLEGEAAGICQGRCGVLPAWSIRPQIQQRSTLTVLGLVLHQVTTRSIDIKTVQLLKTALLFTHTKA